MISFILYPLIFTILVLIITLVVIPMKTLSAYKAKGYSTFFFPVLGGLYRWKQGLETKGDVFADAKEFIKQNPDQKVQICNSGNKIVITLLDPQYIKEFLLKPSLYEKTGATNFIKPLVGGGGLVMSEGEEWKRHRKIISNSFHYESLKTNVSTIKETTLEFLNKTSPEEMKNYPVISKIQEITGEIVGRIFFGRNLNSYTLEGKPLTHVLATLVTDMIVVALTPLGLLFGEKVLEYPVFKTYRDLNKRINDFRNICFKIVEDRKQSEQKGHDLLESLLATQNSPDPEQRLSDKEIVDEFITFFIAGMDTTGHLLGMTLYNLTQNPEYVEKLNQEIKEKYDTAETLTTDTLQTMDELHNVLKESLRMYTPAPITFFRVALVDHKIGELEIKKGTWVNPLFISAFHDERHFPQPEQFNPSRWKENAAKLETYAFTPFSAGPRNCIGQHLAIVESKIIIAEFLKKFDFKLKPGFKLKMEMRFLYEPADEMSFELIPKY